ncbi:MAG: hypothetical protein DRJ18_00660 [Candidatus Methanomethylicota archaeon]|nr:MAG: hypothetical protein DRJ18_00660 [Candidatus Verstraetearchaeota archaeon]
MPTIYDRLRPLARVEADRASELRLYRAFNELIRLRHELADISCRVEELSLAFRRGQIDTCQVRLGLLELRLNARDRELTELLHHLRKSPKWPWEVVADALWAAINNLRAWVEGQLASVWAAINSLRAELGAKIAEIEGRLGAIGDAIEHAIRPAVDALRREVDALKGALQSDVLPSIEALNTAVSGLRELISSQISPALAEVRDWIANKAKPMMEAVANEAMRLFIADALTTEVDPETYEPVHRPVHPLAELLLTPG